MESLTLRVSIALLFRGGEFIAHYHKIILIDLHDLLKSSGWVLYKRTFSTRRPTILRTSRIYREYNKQPICTI